MPSRIPMALLMLPLVVATSASAAEIRGSGFSSGNWKGAAHSSDGAFSYCFMGTPYRSGIRLQFVIDANYLWRMSLSHPDWAMQPDRTLPLRFQIDRGAVNTGEGWIIDPNSIGIELRPRKEEFDQFKRGKLLTVEAGDQVYSFDLSGTSRALSRLLDCANTHVKHRSAAAGAPQPPAPPASMSLDGRMPLMVEPEAPAALLKPAADPGGPVAPPTPPTAATDVPTQAPTAVAALELPERPSPLEHGAPARGEPLLAIAPQDVLSATRFAIGLFGAGELAGHRLIEPADLPEAATEFQREGAVAWLAATGFGAMHVFQPHDAGAEALIDDAIARDVRRCRGAFASGRAPADAGPGIFTAHSSCAPAGGDGFRVDYVAFRHASGKLYLLSSQRPSAAAGEDEAIDALARTVAGTLR